MGTIRDGVFRNDEPTARRPRPQARIEGRAVAWLGILAYIHRHRVTSTQICAEFSISRSQLTRYMQDLEQIYGVVIRYRRRKRQRHLPGWYVIDDWGVLDRAAVLRRFRTR